VESGLEGLRSPRAPDDALRFHGAIFDVDGTLVDSNDAHAHAFVEAFSERGLEVPFERVRRLIGKGADKLIPELIGRYEAAIADRKKAIFKARYLPALRAFPQVETLLAKLRAMGLKLAVASSAGKDELAALLDVAHARPYFDQEANADDAQHSKPDPDIVQAALRRLALSPSRCVMIGDTPYDAEAAHRAGVAFIGVRCGGWDEARLQPALGVYENPADLLGVVSDRM
jgi:HAD superfamily hydrolase (TIGR01509 family)